VVSLTSVGSVGAAIKAFALTHPVGLALAGGVLLGVGASQLLRKKPKTDGEPQAATSA
jgi:hypothetical protein